MYNITVEILVGSSSVTSFKSNGINSFGNALTQSMNFINKNVEDEEVILDYEEKVQKILEPPFNFHYKKLRVDGQELKIKVSAYKE